MGEGFPNIASQKKRLDEKPDSYNRQNEVQTRAKYLIRRKIFRNLPFRARREGCPRVVSQSSQNRRLIEEQLQRTTVAK